jgi:hypothetical protein
MPLRDYPRKRRPSPELLEAISCELWDDLGWYTKAIRIQEAADELRWWRKQYEQSRKAEADL